MIDLYQGDCLDQMDKVPDHTVDMIFTDLPYGTTHNVWDKRIPLEELWKHYKRVLKSGGGSTVIFPAVIYHRFGKFQPKMVSL